MATSWAFIVPEHKWAPKMKFANLRVSESNAQTEHGVKIVTKEIGNCDSVALNCLKCLSDSLEDASLHSATFLEWFGIRTWNLFLDVALTNSPSTGWSLALKTICHLWVVLISAVEFQDKWHHRKQQRIKATFDIACSMGLSNFRYLCKGINVMYQQ